MDHARHLFLFPARRLSSVPGRTYWRNCFAYRNHKGNKLFAMIFIAAGFISVASAMLDSSG
jgi:hypothetical protein